jgi:hypothetical protein
MNDLRAHIEVVHNPNPHCLSLFQELFSEISPRVDQMDTIPLPPDGIAKQLSLLISHRLKSSTLAFLWLICREPGTLKITDVPSAVFDQWAQTHHDSRLRAQFKGSTLVLSMPSNLNDGTASSIGLHIRDTVLAMCPARDARVTCHGGCTSPVEF